MSGTWQNKKLDDGRFVHAMGLNTAKVIVFQNSTGGWSWIIDMRLANNLDGESSTIEGAKYDAETAVIRLLNDDLSTLYRR
jgi:hypothetical protein